MILNHERFVGNIAAALEEHAPPIVTKYHPMLISADWTLAIVSLGALLMLALLWIKNGQGDPLTLAPQRPNRVREDTVLIAVGAYLLLSAGASLIPGLLPDPQELSPAATARTMIVGSATQLAAALVCLLLAHAQFDGGVRAFLYRPEGRSRRFGRIALWTLVVGPLAIGICLWIGELTAIAIHAVDPTYQPPSHPTLEALYGGVSPLATTALWIGAGVIAPAAEELFFRGLLQTWLGRLLRNRWGAIGATSLAFGLVHTGQPHAIPALIALAFILGFAYEMTGVVIVPILIHALFNLKTLVWQALGAAGA